MTSTKKTEEKESFIQGGIIFYPRQYFIDEESTSNSYCEGVNEIGEECVIYIKPPYEAAKSAKRIDSDRTVPTLAEFSEEDRMAKNPCVASSDNSRENPCGILLIERLKEDKKAESKHSCKVYVGGWASVIRVDNRSPDAPIGYGYLEINMNNRYKEEIQKLIPEYEKLRDKNKNDNLTSEEQQRFTELGRIIVSDRYKWFVAVITHPEEMTEIKQENLDDLYKTLRDSMDRYTKDGQYGGNIVRVRDGNKVLMHLSSQCDHQYDYQKKQIADKDAIIDNFMKYNGNRMIKAFERNANLVIEVIPTQRINSQYSNGKFSKEIEQSMGSEPKKIMKTYVDKEFHNDALVDIRKEKAQLYAKVAVRLATIRRGTGKGNQLLSSIHAYTSPINNPYVMNKNGEPEYNEFRFSS